MRLVAVASIPHRIRGMDKDIDRRLNPGAPIYSLVDKI
jgi:hypothetical protein